MSWEGESGEWTGRAACFPKAAHIRKKKGERGPSPGGEGRVRGLLRGARVVRGLLPPRWGETHRQTGRIQPRNNVWISEVRNATSPAVSYAWDSARAGIHPRILLRRRKKKEARPKLREWC